MKLFNISFNFSLSKFTFLTPKTLYIGLGLIALVGIASLAISTKLYNKVEITVPTLSAENALENLALPDRRDLLHDSQYLSNDSNNQNLLTLDLEADFKKHTK